MKTTRTAEEMVSLKNFVAAVIATAKNAPESMKFGRSKVFLAAVNPNKVTASMLLEAHGLGLITLSRADLIPAMDPAVVEASCIVRDMGSIRAEYHMISLEGH